MKAFMSLSSSVLVLLFRVWLITGLHRPCTVAPSNAIFFFAIWGGYSNSKSPLAAWASTLAAWEVLGLHEGDAEVMGGRQLVELGDGVPEHTIPAGPGERRIEADRQLSRLLYPVDPDTLDDVCSPAIAPLSSLRVSPIRRPPRPTRDTQRPLW